MSFAFPKIYPILDSSCIPTVGRAKFLKTLGESLSLAGVTLMEYRNKSATDDEILADAAVLRAAMPSKTCWARWLGPDWHNCPTRFSKRMANTFRTVR